MKKRGALLLILGAKWGGPPIRVISSSRRKSERQSRRAQMSVARRVTCRFRSAARRARRRLPEAAGQ